jgi:hypothetical protein
MAAAASKIKAGEVCSVAVAKKYGLYDNDANQFNAGLLADTRVIYDGTQDFTKPHTLCRESAVDEDAAYPLCMLAAPPELGGKFGFATVDKDNPTQCRTFSCPEGWKVDPEDPRNCMKPKLETIESRDNYCQERWYDWFTIPNYHLGNAYGYHGKSGDEDEKTCKTPCRGNFVPYRRTAKHLTKPEDEAEAVAKGDVCVFKSQFLNGDFKNTPDFCPAAMLKRLSTTSESVKQEIQKNRGESAADPDVRKAVEEQTQRNTTFVVMESHRVIDNVQPQNTSQRYRDSCDYLNKEEENRMRDLYNLCEKFKDEEGHVSKFKEQLQMDIGADDLDLADTLNVIKQSCNALFDATTVVRMDAMDGENRQPMQFTTSPLSADQIKRYNRVHNPKAVPDLESDVEDVAKEGSGSGSSDGSSGTPKKEIKSPFVYLENNPIDAVPNYSPSINDSSVMYMSFGNLLLAISGIMIVVIIILFILNYTFRYLGGLS